MTAHGKPPKVPKGYEPTHTSYKLTTETYFEKPYKPLKASRTKTGKAPAEYIQKVRVVNPDAPKGGRGRKKGR